jgi:hypothetical protein
VAAHVKDTTTKQSAVASYDLAVTSTTGDALFAYVSAYWGTDSALSIASIADSAGNIWNYSTAASSQSPPANGGWDAGGGFWGFAGIGYCVAGPGGGPVQAVTGVTVTMSQTCSTLYYGISEFSGVSPGAVIDGSASASVVATDTSYATPSVTTAGASDVILAVMAAASGSMAVSGIYTIIEMGGVAGGEMAAWALPAPGSQSCTFTMSSQFVIASAVLAVGNTPVSPVIVGRRPAMSAAVRRASFY